MREAIKYVIGALVVTLASPCTQNPVAADYRAAAAIAARARLQAPLTKMNPAGGILAVGECTGRHANKGQ